jgi:phosphoenolpyruvate-protein phosphotransferase
MRENNLKIIEKCCGMLGSATEAAKVLEQLCRYLAEVFNARICALSTFGCTSGGETKMTIRASHGLYYNEIQAFKPGETITELAFKSDHLFNSYIGKDYTYNGVKLLPSIQARCNTMLVMPLHFNGTAIGALTMGRVSKRTFPKWIIDTLNVIATPLAGFLQNLDMARLHATANFGETPYAKMPGQSAEVIGSYNGSYLQGKPIAPGVGLGRAVILAGDDALRNAQLTRTNDLHGERKRLEEALAIVEQSLQKNTRQMSELLAEAEADIFESHLLMLQDPTLHERIDGFLREHYTLEAALSLTFKAFQDDFQKMDDEYLRERIQDVEDILLRLLNATCNATGTPACENAETDDNLPVVLVAHEIFPSQLFAIPIKRISGIVCETGGATAHAAILSRALRIPMVVNLVSIPKIIRPTDELLVDGRDGTCFINPRPELINQYQLLLQNSIAARQIDSRSISGVDDMPMTTDGVPIRLCGNVTLSSEITALHAVGIREIGLYRTEFMFMLRNSLPEEQTQYKILSHLVESAEGAPVTIRALDIGGDKPLSYLKWDPENNPSLGWRGLRFLLSNQEIARPHLRAILRTCAAPNVTLMFPMVADPADMQRARAAVEDAHRSLAAEHIVHGIPKLGMMLEVPSAVACLDQLLPEVDFVSIGTNDLVQYLFAVDRGNNKVTQWFKQCHPVVFRLLGQICQTVAKFPGKDLELCGELAGNQLATPALLGAGLRKLSMNSAAIPRVREYIRKVSLAECQALYAELTKCSTAVETHRRLRDFQAKHG